MSTPLFDVTKAPYFAAGNGTTDDTGALQAALNDAAAANGCLYLPAGVYLISATLAFVTPNVPCQKKLSIKGDGANVSFIKATNGAGGFNFLFDQSGISQPWGVTMRDLGFKCTGAAGTAITISYGSPAVTNDHQQPSVVINNVQIRSDDSNYWANGVDITSAWNVSMTDVYISGSGFGGNWNAMVGAGIALHRSCVNCHFTNVHCNFWAVGFFYTTGTGASDPNAEGLFFTNCSFVAVKRGCWVIGNPNQTINGVPVPRVVGFTWVGGLIEIRSKNVTTGSAAFHLVNVWSAMISGMMMTNEDLTTTSYAVFCDRCQMVTVQGCNLFSWTYGLYTTSPSYAIINASNTFVNVATQTYFNGDTYNSRSYGHALVGGAAYEVNLNPSSNKVGWV